MEDPPDSVFHQRERAVTGLMLQQLREDVVVHLVARAGFDLLIIDREHGTYDLAEVARLATLCRRLDIVPLVRPPDHAYASIARVLDCGARGIVVPRVTSADQVAQVLAAMKYPPVGDRGMASQLGHSDYERPADRRAFADAMNADTLLIVQIELLPAVTSVDEILAVPGVDAALVGPSDLSLSLDPSATDAPDLDRAIQQVVEAGARHDVPIGIQTTDVDGLRRWRRAGMRLLVGGTETALLANAVRDAGRWLGDAAALPVEPSS